MARSRTPSLAIHLTPTPRQTLRAWRWATTIPAGLARWGRMRVCAVDRMPMSPMVTTVGSSRRCVSTWARRLFQAGLEGFADPPVRYSLRCLALIALSFAMLTTALAWHYKVSYGHAAQGLMKEGILSGITGLVALYDPSVTKHAALAPAGIASFDFANYDRIEQLFQASRSVRMPRGQTLHVAHIHNEHIVESAYPFSYQPFDEPRLHALRMQYALDQITQATASEFGGMVRLREWTRSQFRRSDYQPVMANFDALAVLERHRWQTTGTQRPQHFYDPCHFFPLLYAQVLLSVGHQARLVSIGHGMTEVWSNQYRKWVLMDAELNLHYEKHGIPLNMLELLEENYTERPSHVRIQRGHQTSDPNTTLVHLGVEQLSAESMIQAHRTHLALVDLRNDWMTNHYFAGHPARSEFNSLVYADPRLHKPVAFAQRLRPITHRKADVYWTLNQTEILAHKESTADTIPLAFRTVTPNFDYFEITLDTQYKVHSLLPVYTWQLHEGENVFAIRAVNKFGVKGIASFVHVLVESKAPVYIRADAH